MDTYFMNLALLEAKRGAKYTHTNPLVGAIIVKDNKIIARGSHLRYGCEHAEKNAISTCKTPEKLFNSTLYVTLEPCNHKGKQPPCTDSIIKMGISKVVVAQLDPNPIVSGKGIKYLQDNGIEVVTGILEREAYFLNYAYNLFHTEKRPYVALKQATSLDGKLAFTNERTQITGKEVYDFVRNERDNYQAILVGAKTVLIDNPTLLGSNTSLFPPKRIILDAEGSIFEQSNLNLFKDSSSEVIIFSKFSHENLPSHVTIITPEEFSIKEILSEIAKLGIQSVYVEGGPCIHDQFLASGCWDEVITYISPILLGGNNTSSFTSNRITNEKIQLHDTNVTKLGNDIRISGRRVSQCLQD
jgi:riboflavin biosynthesis protein ribD